MTVADGRWHKSARSFAAKWLRLRQNRAELVSLPKTKNITAVTKKASYRRECL